MSGSEKIRVVMTGYERVQYHQVREIPLEEWRRFEALVEAEDEEGITKLADLLIERSDVSDADGIEDFDMRIEKTAQPTPAISSKERSHG